MPFSNLRPQLIFIGVLDLPNWGGGVLIKFVHTGELAGEWQTCLTSGSDEASRGRKLGW